MMKFVSISSIGGDVMGPVINANPFSEWFAGRQTGPPVLMIFGGLNIQETVEELLLK